MATRSNTAVPATPARSGGHDDHSDMASDTEREATAGRSVSFEDSADGRDAKEDDDYDEDDEDLEDKAPVQVLDLLEDVDVFVTKSGGVRSLSHSLADEIDGAGSSPEPAQQGYDDLNEDPVPVFYLTKNATQNQEGNRPPVNGDTPAANKVLGRCLETMQETSDWMQLFAPKLVRQAVWTDLKEELSYPVNSTSTTQVANDTVFLLMAMGSDAEAYPSSAALADWSPTEAGADLHKWKKKLRAAFGSHGIGAGRHPVTGAVTKNVKPAQVPLLQTPKKSNPKKQTVFASSAERSPYMQDSHMVTPRSATRTARLARETTGTTATADTRRGTGRRATRRATRRAGGEDSLSDDDFDPFGMGDDGDDQAGELARQIRELSEMESHNVTPRIEVATHRPLAQTTPFRGDLEKSENSMQWLRAFVYEMKGTHTPPNEWCVAFQLSLRDGAVHWHRALSRKTKRTWSLLSDKFIKYYCSQFSQPASTRYYRAKRANQEHIRDYSNRLKGYARSANIKFEHGGRAAKDHVKHFLETCGDKQLEKQLCPMQLSDIHVLEDIVSDMLKVEKRASSREPLSQPTRTRDHPRRREDRRHDDSRDYYGRRDRTDRRDRDRDYNRRRGDSRQQPRVALAEATLTDIISELQHRDPYDKRDDYSDERQPSYSGDEGSDHDDKGGDYDSQYDSHSDQDNSDNDDRHLAAANDNERRAAADGTYARSDRLPPAGGAPGHGFDRGDRRGARDGRDGRDGRDNRDYRDNRSRQYGPCAACGGLSHSTHCCYRRCKLCMQVHHAGKCEAFQQLTTLLRSKVEKKDLSPEFQNIVFVGHLN